MCHRPPASVSGQAEPNRRSYSIPPHDFGNISFACAFFYGKQNINTIPGYDDDLCFYQLLPEAVDEDSGYKGTWYLWRNAPRVSCLALPASTAGWIGSRSLRCPLTTEVSPIPAANAGSARGVLFFGQPESDEFP